MESTLKAYTTQKTGHNFRLSRRQLRFLMIGLVILLAISLIGWYIWQNVYKTKAGTQDVTTEFTPASTRVELNQEFSLPLRLTADATQKISGAQIIISYDEGKNLVDYVPQPLSGLSADYTDLIVQEATQSGTFKQVKLTVTASNSASLKNINIINLKFKAKNTIGQTTFKLDPVLSQVSGTADAYIFNLLPKDVTIGIGQGVTIVPTTNLTVSPSISISPSITTILSPSVNPSVSPSTSPIVTQPITPTINPNVPKWDMIAVPVCAQGTTLIKNVRAYGIFWPPSPLEFQYAGYSKSAELTMTMQPRAPYPNDNAAYFGLEDESGRSFTPIGTASNAQLFYGTYFNPATPLVKWQQKLLPAGTYRVEFQMPADMCSQPGVTPTLTSTLTPTLTPSITASPNPTHSITPSFTPIVTISSNPTIAQSTSTPIPPTSVPTPIACSASNACPSNYACMNNVCRPLYCQSATASTNFLTREQPVTLVSTANESTMSRFLYAFYNLDNLDPQNGTPKPVFFEQNKHYVVGVDANPAAQTANTAIDFDMLNRPDLNNGGKVPRNLQVNAYFVGPKGLSAPETSCVVQFTTETPDAILKLKLRMQGITKVVPEQYNNLKVKVTVAGGKLEQPVVANATFKQTGSEIWEGTVGLKGNFPENQKNYALLIKAQKHLQRKVCEIDPGKVADNENGLYTCTDYVESFITINSGENNFDLTNIYQPAGDLATDGNQDGVIDSIDLVQLRSKLGNKNSSELPLLDLNLDGIIDAQDHSLPVKILDLNVNTDDE